MNQTVVQSPMVNVGNCLGRAFTKLREAREQRHREMQLEAISMQLRRDLLQIEKVAPNYIAASFPRGIDNLSREEVLGHGAYRVGYYRQMWGFGPQRIRAHMRPVYITPQTIYATA